MNSISSNAQLRIAVSALFTALILAAAALCAPQAIAADDDKIYLVNYAKFKPGKAPQALQIIRERFFPVDKAIGRRVLPFDPVTGDWDHIVYFPFDLARMDTIPSNEVWMRTLAEREGGMDQAQKLWQEFWDLVDHSKTEIARLPSMWAP